MLNDMAKKTPLYQSAEGYDLAAPKYDEKANFLNTFEQGKILPLLNELKEKRVLDVGAGTGRMSVQLQKLGADVTALDLSVQMLAALSKKNPNIKTIIGDAESLPFANNHFDLVTALFLIVHLKDPTMFFSEAHRVLKDGGQFLVTNINQRKAPPVETTHGPIVIESYYHRPEHVRGTLEALAFTVEKEVFVREGENWINQILLVRK